MCLRPEMKQAKKYNASYSLLMILYPGDTIRFFQFLHRHCYYSYQLYEKIAVVLDISHKVPEFEIVPLLLLPRVQGLNIFLNL